MRQGRLASARPSDQEGESFALLDPPHEPQTRLLLSVARIIEASVRLVLERLGIEIVEAQVIQLGSPTFAGVQLS